MSSVSVDWEKIHVPIRTDVKILTFSQFRQMGKQFREQFVIEDEKRAKEFAETGHMNKALSPSLKKWGKIRNSMLANHATKRLDTPVWKNGKWQMLPPNYIIMSLLGDVIDEDLRSKKLQKIIDHALEKNDKATLKAAIQTGVDYHIPGPIAPFATKLKTKDRIEYLKANIAAQGMTEEMHQQLDTVKTKTSLHKSNILLSRLYQDLSQVEKDPEQKMILFENAMHYTSELRTEKLRNQRYRSLQNLVVSGGDKKNPYEQFRNRREFDIVQKTHGPAPMEKPLEKLKALPLEEFKQEITHYNSPALKIAAYTYFSTVAENDDDKLQLYREAAKEINRFKTPEAKARNFAVLRPNAPTQKAFLGTHDLFLQNAPFKLLLEDTIELGKNRFKNSDLLRPSLFAIHDQREKTLENQRLYTPLGSTFSHIAGGLMLPSEFRF